MPYKLVVALALLAGLLVSPAEARHRHHHHYKTIRIELRGVPMTVTRNVQSENIIGGRPAGCPHAYCGCGARKYLGIEDVRLNLASNWPHYYRGLTQVAVWNHHIAIIERITGPGMAILRDYNSGSGLSRIHERSIAGARIVGGGSDYSAATIHYQTGSRHIGRGVRHQESDRAFHFFDPGKPLHGDLG